MNKEQKQLKANPGIQKREDFRSAFKALCEEAADIPEMSLEEINAEISSARAERKRGSL